MANAFFAASICFFVTAPSRRARSDSNAASSPALELSWTTASSSSLVTSTAALSLATRVSNVSSRDESAFERSFLDESSSSSFETGVMTSAMSAALRRSLRVASSSAASSAASTRRMAPYLHSSTAALSSLARFTTSRRSTKR